MVQWKHLPQQPQHAETSDKPDSLVHESQPRIEIENLAPEERRFFGGIDEYQSCRLLGMVAGEAADNETAVGVRRQNVRSWDSCFGQQRVKVFGAICNCASRCNRLAPAVTGS